MITKEKSLLDERLQQHNLFLKQHNSNRKDILDLIGSVSTDKDVKANIDYIQSLDIVFRPSILPLIFLDIPKINKNKNALMNEVYKTRSPETYTMMRKMLKDQEQNPLVIQLGFIKLILQGDIGNGEFNQYIDNEKIKYIATTIKYPDFIIYTCDILYRLKASDLISFSVNVFALIDTLV